MLQLVYLEVYCILKCICICVCPNLIRQQTRDPLGLQLYCVSQPPTPNHLTHPAPAEPQSAVTEPRCSSMLRRSRQFHSAVHRWLTVCITSSHLWMSVDVSNQGATGQQQTSVTQCFPGALPLLPKHGSQRQPSDGRAGTDMKKSNSMCHLDSYLWK